MQKRVPKARAWVWIDLNYWVSLNYGGARIDSLSRSLLNDIEPHLLPIHWGFVGYVGVDGTPGRTCSQFGDVPAVS